MELGISMIYAEALYEAAKDLGHVDEVRSELEQIAEITRGEEDFRRTLLNPAVSAANKKAMIRNIFGGRVQEEVVSFLCLLIDKGRIYGFHSIVRQYGKLVDEAKGMADGIVYSAVPIADAQIRKLEEDASRLMGKQIHLRNKVDKTLIGGVRVFVEGKLIDASFRTRLDRIAEEIMKN